MQVVQTGAKNIEIAIMTSDKNVRVSLQDIILNGLHCMFVLMRLVLESGS